MRTHLVATAVATLAACTGPSPEGRVPAVSTAPGPSDTASPIPSEHGTVSLVRAALPDESVALATALFSPATELPFPDTCAMAGLLCLDTLPSTAGAPVPIGGVPSPGPTTWAGDEIFLDGHAVPFVVRAGAGGYRRRLPRMPPGPLELTLDGQGWGPHRQVVSTPAPLELLSPRPDRFTNLTGDHPLSLRWRPAPSALLLLEIRGPSTSTVIALNDDGEHVLPPEAWQPLARGEQVTLVLSRIAEEARAVGPHVLTVRAISQVHLDAGDTWPASCADQLRLDPASPDGVYTLQPDPRGDPVDLYCDMTTDDGGWTLLAASRGTFDDQGAPWTRSLLSLLPEEPALGVYAGMGTAFGERADLRFACRQAGQIAMDVDLSFYDVDWYGHITAPTDAGSCFLDDDGAGFETAPARRDNVSGAWLPAGDPWNTDGYLEGEDACDDTDDFTVDFDDRGMDGEQSDGTDWGEDDGVPKCGTSGVGDAWFVFGR